MFTLFTQEEAKARDVYPRLDLYKAKQGEIPALLYDETVVNHRYIMILLLQIYFSCLNMNIDLHLPLQKYVL